MSSLKDIKNEFQGMLSKPQLPSSPNSIDSKRLVILIATLAMMAVVGAGLGYLLKESKPKSPGNGGKPPSESAANTQDSGPLVISFKSPVSGGGAVKGAGVSEGSLVRVRLLNSVETYESVPAFAQVSDYSLGDALYGATLVGDASGDAGFERVKIRFHLVRHKSGSYSKAIEGIALSLDGTLGLRAEKIEGLMNRALVGAGRSGASGLSGGMKGSGDLSSLIARALVQGLESEISSDLGSKYNQMSALRVKPGAEFYVQLTAPF